MSNMILNVLAEDKRAIAYRPSFARCLGSVPAAILLQQIIYWYTTKSCEPFYKFKEPCEHQDYKAGDSWIEELVFTRFEFDAALRHIGVKLGSADIRDKQRRENPNALVYYWTDISRRTWYEVNETALRNVADRLYVSLKTNVTYSDFPAIDSTENTIDEPEGDSSAPVSQVADTAPKATLEAPPTQPQTEAKIDSQIPLLTTNAESQSTQPAQPPSKSLDDSKKSSAAPKTEQPPRPRDPVFDAIAQHWYQEEPGSERAKNGLGSAVGQIRKAIKAYDPDVTAERIQRFVVWYRNRHRGLSLPGHAKVAGFYSEWFNSVKKTSASDPAKGTRHLNADDANDSFYEVYNGTAWIREGAQ